VKRVPLTLRGAQRLREELKELKTVQRPRIVQAIAEARAHGDLSENAEYHAAKEEQGFIEGRIQSIEACLAGAQIIDPSRLNVGEKVVFGATVELLNVESEETVRYQLVGDMEADIRTGRISISSPIARALVGKFGGDQVIVRAPSGDIEYEIVVVDYL